MATIQISTRRITKEFRTLRNRSLVVTRRGQDLGAWTPARAKPVSDDLASREFRPPIPYKQNDMESA